MRLVCTPLGLTGVGCTTTHCDELDSCRILRAICRRDSAVDAGIAANLDAAFAAALLLLPPCFTTQQLLEAVTGLSYTADIRMSFAEDSNKVGLPHFAAC